MIFPGGVIIAVLETMSYETCVTITGFPCCVTYRQELADGLIHLGLIEKYEIGYSLTERGQIFLNNSNNYSKI